MQALKDSLVGKADHFSHFNDRTLKDPIATVTESDLVMAIFALSLSSSAPRIRFPETWFPGCTPTSSG